MTTASRSSLGFPRIATACVSGRVEVLTVAAIIAFATVSALLWALVRVPGEGGPDETAHLGLIARVRDTGGIPVFEGFERGKFSGSPGRVINAYELTPNLSAFALASVAGAIGAHDLAATVLIGRLYSVALFPVTLTLAYLTLRRLLPNRVIERIWAVTAIATIPQFMLVHTYVTNDTPTIAFATLAIYALVRGWDEGFRWRDIVLLGVAVGLVALHKANGLIVLPMAAALMAWRLRHQPARLLTCVGAVAALALAIAGWWYVRMLLIYGDALGVATTQAAVNATGTAVATPRDQGLSPWDYAAASGWVEGTFRSFWAGYGVRKMTLPDTAYLALFAVLLVSAAGLISVIVRTRARASRDSALWIAFAAAFAVLWGLNFWSSWTLDGAAMHGRYVYPAIVPFAALLAVGLGEAGAWLGRSRSLLAMTIPLMIAANLAYFVRVVIPDVVALGA